MRGGKLPYALMRKAKKKLSAKDLKLKQEWEEMLKKHMKPLEKGMRRGEMKLVASGTSGKSMLYSTQVRRPKTEQELLESMKGSTAKVQNQYTGNKIVGIAAMHKSNLVPIFNDDAAKDVASMRR